MNNQPIMMMELIQRYCCNEKIADTAPELNFVWELAKQVKERGCYCGLNKEISKSTARFNQAVQNLSEDSLNKMSIFLNQKELCFGILESAKFFSKCYQIK